MTVPAFVYVITHTPTLRHYVGKTVRLQRRWKEHKRDCRKAMVGDVGVGYIHKAMARHGVGAFTFQAVESFDTEDEALEAEAWWIAFLRSNVKGYGFNLESGGRGGKTPSVETLARLSAAATGKTRSAETRAKMSAAKRQMSPETKAKIAAARRGKEASPEARAKMSAAKTGKPLSPEHRANSAAGVRSEASREKNRASHVGVRPSAESRARMSEGQRRRHARERELNERRKSDPGGPGGGMDAVDQRGTHHDEAGRLPSQGA